MMVQFCIHGSSKAPQVFVRFPDGEVFKTTTKNPEYIFEALLAVAAANVLAAMATANRMVN